MKLRSNAYMKDNIAQATVGPAEIGDAVHAMIDITLPVTLR
jgi:hypothetical protein